MSSMGICGVSQFVLPASPNWYCSKVADANNGVFVYGARREVFVFDVTINPPEYKGTFKQHRDKVCGVALGFDSDQKDAICCSGSEDGRIKIWNVKTKDQLFEHNAHRGKVTAVAWSVLDDGLAVSGDDRGDVAVFQYKEGRVQTYSPENAAVTCMACSPCTAHNVAVGYKSGVILLLDVKKDVQILQRLRGHDEDVHCVAWCPIPGEDYKISQLQSSDDSERVIVPGENIFEIPDEGYNTGKPVNFGEEGHLLASGSKDKTIRIWSTSKGRQLLQLRIPKTGGAGREQGSDYGQNKIWNTLVWLKTNPLHLVSSSFGGDLLKWDLSIHGQQKHQVFSSNKKIAHYRMVFGLCLAAENIICSISMDRQIILWDTSTESPVGAMPTLGGFVYVAKTSPVDPGRLAFGVGDSMIRVWNMNNASYPLQIKSLWQGVKGKVTALSWHPVKEGVLGFGTDDGRVGIYDTLSNKPPNISSTYHKKTVYVVAWGPASQESTEDKMVHCLYSVGDGSILEHEPYALHDEAIQINEVIQKNKPGEKIKFPTRSEISWNPDFSLVAIGNDDGSLEIYRTPSFSHIATVHIHKKLVNTIQWHPHFTVASPGGSAHKNYIAFGSNEAGVGIVDLTSVLESGEEGRTPVTINEVLKCLLGHVDRVTGVVWSPHADNLFATVSYDGQALVWDVDTGQMLACYQGHQGRLLCVQWSGLETDALFTGADDFTLHKWSYKCHPPTADNAGRQRKHRSKGKKQRKKWEEGTKMVENPGGDASSVVMTTDEKAELEKLLEDKKKLLMDQKSGITENGDNKENIIGNEERTIVSTSDVMSTAVSKHTKEDTAPQCLKQKEVRQESDKLKTETSSGKEKKKKPWKVKSMFPLTGRAENRGKELLLEDLVYLTKAIYCSENKSSEDIGGKPRGTACPDLPPDLGQDTNNQDDEEEGEDDHLHLGFFLDRRGMYRCLRQEGQHHCDNDNMDYYYQLEIWKGNINGVLRLAREREELSDWLVSMAPMATYDTWVTVCEDYAAQLESDGQYHKAATYLLAAHKVYDAIELFRRHRLFKEAIALAKVRLSPFDPVLEDLYTLWAQQLTRDGNYEQAAKCHLAMKQVQDAALLLARRYNQSSMKTASHICLLASDKQQGLMYAHKVATQYMVQSEWREAYKFLKEQKSLQCLTAVTAMHELLMKELSKTSGEEVSGDKFTNWDESNAKPVLPDFILDCKENDPISPWQPELVDGHTFPHLVLRVLYSNLDIKMGTSNLEDMYKALSVLHAGRQIQTELQQLSVQVCMDLVLCLLSLLMSETPTAISHLLQAVSLLHEAGHQDIMETVLKLFLPQGPKYLLKLQQEVTAMRVVISMEDHSNLDGASKVHTIKRYLTDLKDDDSISHSSLRCRELDCLRAYYYLSILYFLRKTLHRSDEDDGSSGALSSAGVADGSVVCDKTEESVKLINSEQSAISDAKCVKQIQGIETCDNNPCSETSLSDNKTESQNEAVLPSSPTVPLPSPPKSPIDNTGASDTENVQISDTEHKSKPNGSSADGEIALKGDNSPSEINSKVLTGSVEKPLDTALEKKDPLSFFFDVQRQPATYQLTMPVLSHLARGLLWDMQGKRYALTETLGYIHKAISQLLLSQRPTSALPTAHSETSGDRASVGSEASVASGGHMTMSIPAAPEQSAEDHFNDQLSALRLSTSSEQRKKRHHSEPVIQTPSDKSVCPFHGAAGSSAFCRSLSSDNSNVDIGLPFPENFNMAEIDIDPENDGLGICASCEWLTKSRKVLWEDEPHFHPSAGIEHGHSNKDKLSSILNPAKYINVPDEWYNMTADQKYSMPYVTMAILKEEQEYMMHELKRGPDALQMPFPSPMDSVKLLLDIGAKSQFLFPPDKHKFTEKVITWGMKFSVSSQQKEALLEVLHRTLTHQ